jgi:hypothetical protein
MREPRLCLKPFALFVAMYYIGAVSHGNATGVCNPIGRSMHMGEPLG